MIKPNKIESKKIKPNSPEPPKRICTRLGQTQIEIQTPRFHAPNHSHCTRLKRKFHFTTRLHRTTQSLSKSQHPLYQRRTHNTHQHRYPEHTSHKTSLSTLIPKAPTPTKISPHRTSRPATPITTKSPPEVLTLALKLPTTKIIYPENPRAHRQKRPKT
jgi:hypothetical protein